MDRPNFLVILTDQMRRPPAYESAELARWRADSMPGVERLRREGVSFAHHYTMATACAPSRASLLTGQYPSLHGVTQTDGLAKTADGPDVFWLAPGMVPTLGDWFRAGGYRTFYKGKWHASHVHLDAEDGDGYLLSIDDDGKPIEANVARYLEADLLDDYGFSEWVGPEPHGLGKHNTGTVKDPFTADETIALLRRLEGEEEEGSPWLTVCSLLNPHDDSLFGLVGLTQGLRYHPSQVPHVAQAPTYDEDLSTKPACHASYNEEWGKILAPQPWIEAHLKFYYQLQATVDEQITRVLDALAGSAAAADTIVVFSSDHGDMQGAHGGMHEKWHVAYEEALSVPLIISGPTLAEGREVEMPTSHADLLPTMLGLAGIDHEEALRVLLDDHSEARALVGRDLSGELRGDRCDGAAPILFTTDDEISEGSVPGPSPFQRFARRTRRYSEIVQPNHLETVVAEVEVDGDPHLVKLSRYHDNQQFWTVPGERDERLRRRRRTEIVTEPEPDEYELYDLTLDPYEERNLAHPSYADAGSRALRARMLELLIAQLAEKRLVPSAGEIPGYRSPLQRERVDA
jgi:arylsulfatase A-like enzyme